MTLYLERIAVRFPGPHTEFTYDLASLINALGHNKNDVLGLTRSNQDFSPKRLVDFKSRRSDILTDFTLSNGDNISVKIENSMGLSKQSPHSYQPISVKTVSQRFVTSGVRLVGIDHVGFRAKPPHTLAPSAGQRPPTEVA